MGKTDGEQHWQKDEPESRDIKEQLALDVRIAKAEIHSDARRIAAIEAKVARGGPESAKFEAVLKRKQKEHVDAKAKLAGLEEQLAEQDKKMNEASGGINARLDEL